nr:hypothetical protein RVX_2224 [Nitratidesulfovibrio sp. HK-II]
MFFLRVVSGLRGVMRDVGRCACGLFLQAPRRGIRCFPSPAGRLARSDFRSPAKSRAGAFG